jgi:hypothetical protein
MAIRKIRNVLITFTRNINTSKITAYITFDRFFFLFFFFLFFGGFFSKLPFHLRNNSKA